jgi:glycosyltransferase involved in cell wall biosynthesis
MRICFVVDKVLRGEGIGEYVTELYKYLSKKNKIDLLTRMENTGVPIKKVEWGAPGLLKYFRPYKYGKLDNYDVVVSNFPTVAPILTAIKISKEQDIAHVVHDYGIVSSGSFSNARAKYAHKIETFIMPHVYAKGDKIITISKFLQRELKEKNIKSDVGYGGITYSKYQKKKKTDILKKFGLKTDNYVLFVGRISEHKGIHKLIEAWKKSKTKLSLAVVGGFPVGDYEQRIKKMSEGTSIVFTGKLSEDDVIAMFQNCAFYCLASIGEAYNLTLLEAQSCGKPVLLFNAGAPPEIVLNKKTGFLVKPNDLKEYAERIRLLGSNKALRKTMGKAAKRWAKNFDWNVLGKKFEAMYQEAITERRRK